MKPVKVRPIRRNYCCDCGFKTPLTSACIAKQDDLVANACKARTILNYQTVSDVVVDRDTKNIDSTASSKRSAELSSEYTQPKIQCRRPLGSMELFMLPRPVGPTAESKLSRPPMNHVCAVLLSSTPSTKALRLALDNAVRAHPLLRARIEGDGYPRKWLDPVRRMVRWGGDERPLEFVVHAASDDDGEIYRKNVMENTVSDSVTMLENPAYWGGSLSIVNVPGSTKRDLNDSWQKRFEKDLDSETAVAVVAEDTGEATTACSSRHLWKMELHRFSPDNHHSSQQPCALLITLNHCISDQGSLNMVIDQILSDVAELESSESCSIQHPAIAQPMPVNVCESLLGKDAGDVSFTRILESVFSPSFRKLREYALGKFQECLSSPALLPITKSIDNDGTGGGLVTPASILLFGTPLNGSKDITQVRSTVQYRWLPPDVTSALVKKSKSHRVPISMTLAAAVAATVTDHFSPDNEAKALSASQEQRMYKILQSLDTRRFHGASDPGDTLSCQAGSMDLILGPLPDFLGKGIRSHSRSSLDKFWKVAKQCFDQTSSYLKSGDAIEAVRLFDMGMAISDIGRLVESYARSNATVGRAWSAGITNAGEYERQQAVLRKGLPREQLKRSHGDYEIHEIYYATSHARIGCTYPVGCLSVGGGMSFSINPPWPIITEAESKTFADDFTQLLRTIATDDA
ncbi:hypothetical protein HJC23_012452 [Cyclotella cryptica]|uniref:Uncharacterized protein n=1 Tax=Cyclotella cryptica TaxID=29204 RepID=A0ABD3P5I2_9STRA